jgi:hypothetical protein
LQSTRKLFHDGRFPRATDGQIADADDQATEYPLPKDSFPIKIKAKLNETFVDEGKRVKDSAQKRGANATAALENNIDPELL